MNIIFMGTSEFAIPTLKSLSLSKKHNVVAVFSQKPRQQGRGMKITRSPVHKLADLYDISVYTPTTLKDSESLKIIDSIAADVVVVAAYGLIVPIDILNLKKYGCLNIHPSKLPKYRGAAPLQRTIIQGERETAVCIIEMDKGLDSGDIILQEDLSLDLNITFESLHDKCAQIGSDLLLKALDNLHSLARTQQLNTGISYAHKLTKKESRINWYSSAFKIDCMIRGMNPWPGVYFPIKNKKIKILEAEHSTIKHNYKPGKIINKFFDIACQEGILHIKSLKPEGKSIMSSADYLRGNQNSIIGSIIESY